MGILNRMMADFPTRRTEFTPSPVATAAYLIQIPTSPTLSISPAGGSYTNAQTVTLADTGSNAAIYYTLNGSEPTTASTPYTAPFTMGGSGTITVTAVALVAGASISPSAHAAFIFPAGTAPVYTWTNVQIVGGGFVDGLYFHPSSKGLMYARTDVGGAYRFNNVPGGDTQWMPLLDFIGRSDNGFNLGVDSLGLDPNDPKRLYLAVGEYADSYGTNDYVLVSGDMGQTFRSAALPFKNGSNDNGRFAGERLSVDPANSSHIYFGTRLNGLYESTDQAISFHPVHRHTWPWHHRGRQP